LHRGSTAPLGIVQGGVIRSPAAATARRGYKPRLPSGDKDGLRPLCEVTNYVKLGHGRHRKSVRLPAWHQPSGEGTSHSFSVS
jgi:hypothetical protein